MKYSSNNVLSYGVYCVGFPLLYQVCCPYAILLLAGVNECSVMPVGNTDKSHHKSKVSTEVVPTERGKFMRRIWEVHSISAVHKGVTLPLQVLFSQGRLGEKTHSHLACPWWSPPMNHATHQKARRPCRRPSVSDILLPPPPPPPASSSTATGWRCLWGRSSKNECFAVSRWHQSESYLDPSRWLVLFSLHCVRSCYLLASIC